MSRGVLRVGEKTGCYFSTGGYCGLQYFTFTVRLAGSFLHRSWVLESMDGWALSGVEDMVQANHVHVASHLQLTAGNGNTVQIDERTGATATHDWKP